MSAVPDSRPMTEAQLQAAVVKLCGLYGLKYHRQRYPPGSRAGWPRLVVAGRVLLFRELRRQHVKVTRAQREWGIAIGDAGGDWGIWRPGDLASGRIHKELEAAR